MEIWILQGSLMLSVNEDTASYLLLLGSSMRRRRYPRRKKGRKEKLVTVKNQTTVQPVS